MSEWSIYGMVCLTGLFLLTPLTHLKRDWINSGTIKILFMIPEHSYREPEVRVMFCMINFSKLVYCKVIFSERELMFMFAICRRASVCRLSVVCNVRAPYSAD